MLKSHVPPLVALAFGLVCMLGSVVLIRNIPNQLPSAQNTENIRYWCGRVVDTDGKSLMEIQQAVTRFHPESKKDGLDLKMCKLYLDF